eukprot:XP_001698640.1 predicted protein [Chlamydomonas reinhardtii]
MAAPTSSPPALFKPFRALGYITDNVPFAVQRRGKETFVTTSVGKNFQVYNCNKLTLSLVGPQLPGDIRCLAAKGDLTFAARVIELGAGGSFTPTCLTHPDTYLHKVLLWNYRTGQLLFSFKGWGCGVRCMAPSPALDVVGVGLADGRVVLHNVRYDEQLSLHWFAGEPLLMSSAADNSLKHWVFDTGADAAPRLLSGAVVGVAADGSNRLLVSVGLDGLMRVWDFRTLQLKSQVSLGGPASRLALHPASGLAAVGLADSSIRLYDVEGPQPRLVRRFRGHADRLTGLALSADSRWCLSAAMDGTLRVWDVPAGQCLQVLRLGAPVTGLSLGPGLDLLATTHALFGAAFAIPHSDAPVPVVRTALPSVLGAATGGGEDLQAGGEEAGSVGRLVQEEDEEDEDGVDSEAEAAARRRYAGRDPVSGCPLPLAPALVTLSLLPRSQWDSLAHIEVIKARNKPLAPPKKPEAAPFFLPTLPALSYAPLGISTMYHTATQPDRLSPLPPQDKHTRSSVFPTRSALCWCGRVLMGAAARSRASSPGSAAGHSATVTAPPPARAPNGCARAWGHFHPLSHPQCLVAFCSRK